MQGPNKHFQPLSCGFCLLASLLLDEAALRGCKSSVGSGQRSWGRSGRRGSTASAVILCLVLAMFGDAIRAEEPLYDIDVASMNAAEALNRFAEQTGTIMLFPYDVARSRQANAVRGRYTLLDGLERLLQGTGLTGGLSNKRVVNISHGEDRRRPGEEGAMYKQKESVGAKLAAFVASMFSVSAGADAAAADETTAALPLEEVTVTATRRAESLQEVALSITAYGEEELRRTGALDFQAIADRVPGLTFTAYGVGANRYFIRGIGQVATNQSPTTGLYFDETPLQVRTTTGHFQPEPILYDLERVEVLRGPQGTLFGSSAMGGSIRFIGNKPDASAFGGSLSAGVSTVKDGEEGYDLKGMVNVPLVEDKFAVRVVGVHTSEPGWIDDLRPSTSNISENRGSAAVREDTNSVDTNAARIMASITPSDTFRILPTFYYQERKSGTVRAVSDEVFGADARLKARWIDEPVEMRLWTGNLMLEKDLDWFGGVSLLSSTSRLEASFDRVVDLTAFNNPQFSVNRTQVGFFSEQEANQWTQDVRLVSQSQNALQFVVGLYYSDTEAPTVVTNRVINDFGGGLAPEQRLRNFDFSQEERAAYGELTYQMGSFKLSAGGRYFSYEQVDSRYQRRPSGVDFDFEISGDESGFTPHVALSYMPSDNQNYYLTYAEGYRTGGVNAPITEDSCSAAARQALGIPDVPPPFESDRTKNHELGMKLQSRDGRAGLRSAIYYIDWDDYQQAISRDCGGTASFSYTANAGQVRSQGAELELELHPVSNLELKGGVAYVDAKFKQPNEQLGIVPGDRLWDVPEWTYNASAEYQFDLTTALIGRVKVDGNYVSESRSGVAEDVPPPWREQYTLVNVDFGLVASAWDLTLYVRNVTDEVPNYGLDFALGGAVSPIPYGRITGQPRVIGLTYARKFW